MPVNTAETTKDVEAASLNRPIAVILFSSLTGVVIAFTSAS